MVTGEERYRLSHYQSGERPSGMYGVVRFFSKDAHETVARLRAAMVTISGHGGKDWPNDEQWKTLLPDWLTSTFRIYSKDELARIRSDRSNWANLQWTLGSWLDRMRDRDWEWWSVSMAGNSVRVCIVVDGYPFSTNALEHLIVAAGGYGLSVEG